MTNYKKHTTPDGYEQENIFIDLKQNCSITTSVAGVVKINNLLVKNSNNQSFSNIQIFFSKEKKRYLICADVKNAYNIDDLLEMKRKSKSFLTYENLIEMLDLDPLDFDLSNYSLKGKDMKTIFMSRSSKKRIFDCATYVIIG